MRKEGYTHTGKKENEDIFGITESSVFVLDGASALLDTNFTPNGNDVVWMVKWWKNYLLDHLDDLTVSIQDIMKNGIEQINKDFSKYQPIDKLSKLELVSAGIGIMRMHDEFFEIFVLGDVEISVLQENNVDIYTDERIKPLDQSVIDLMATNENRLNECVFKGFTEAELELLKINRNKMNTDEGYYILSTDEKAVDNSIYKKISKTSQVKCMIASDGLSLLDKYYTREKLISEVAKRGVQSLIEELRAYENEDKDKVKMKRLKTHDDATGVFVEW